jgi:two-component system, cell cycle response regulator DivK
MARILVVEDDRLSLKLVTVVLKRAGHEVKGAENAREAEQVLRGFSPHLIVMDLDLPGQDGASYTHDLRGRPGTTHLPILAVTAYPIDWGERVARAAGCDDYLTKPIPEHLLCERVSHLLEVSGPRS